MKQTPLLFNSDMVRALLDGRKTMTRRIIKDQPSNEFNEYITDEPKESDCFFAVAGNIGCYYERPIKCPYGYKGDLIWARETWATDSQLDGIKPSDLSMGEPIDYLADDGKRRTGCEMIERGKTRQSMFMTKWASRLTLKITDVRVERVQDISEEDARNEGIYFIEDNDHKTGWLYKENHFAGTAKHAFKELWNSINGNWDNNPWVWCISFEVIKQNIDDYLKEAA